jgi:hypothetical protein
MQVRSEAEAIYATKSLFVLPHRWHLGDPSGPPRPDTAPHTITVLSAYMVTYQDVSFFFNDQQCSHLSTHNIDIDQPHETAHKLSKPV